MKKKALLRGLLGVPLGMAMGYLITIVISLGWGQGRYVACMPELIALAGSEAGAVALQAVLCGVLGAAFAMCSVIWDMERWSLLKQSAVYFAVTALVMLPIAWVCGWMEHSAGGVAGYAGVFVGIFAAAWVAQYLMLRGKIRRLNRRVHGEN